MKTGGVVAGVSLGAGLPLSVFMALNFMRPDLLLPMLDHVFGYTLVGVVVGLSALASTLFSFAFSLEFKSRASQVILIVCAVVLGTIPAVFGVLFGPIVFAFMYGNAA